MKTIKIWILIAMIFLSGGLFLENVEVGKAALDDCTKFRGNCDGSMKDYDANKWCTYNRGCDGTLISGDHAVLCGDCGVDKSAAFCGNPAVDSDTDLNSVYTIDCWCYTNPIPQCNPWLGSCSANDNPGGTVFEENCTLRDTCSGGDGLDRDWICGHFAPANCGKDSGDPCGRRNFGACTQDTAHCDDTPTGCCGQLGKVCVGGACVLTKNLVLTATAHPNSLALNGTSLVYFKVTLDGNPVAGATVNGISLLGGSVGGGIVLNDCLTENTDASGRCTVFYTNPNTAGSFNVSATHASKTGETGSGPANAIINVSGCPVMVPQTWGCGASHTACGPGVLPDPPALDHVICTISGGVSVRHTFFDGISYTCSANDCQSVDFTCPAGCNAACDDCAGACLPGTCNGCNWCDGGWDPPISIDCTDNNGDLVSGAPGCCNVCVGGGGGGGGGGGCTVVWGGWSNPCSETPGTETRSDSGTCGLPDQSRLCCDNDSHCVNPTPICDIPADRCIECLTNPDCDVKGPGFVCEAKVCIPCKTEGENADAPELCCEGLYWWDKNDDGNPVCTSACDPKASFFCNPLRRTAETLIEGGETMLGYILGLIGSIALLLVIVAGIMYMTAAGVEEKITSAKRILTGAVIGLGIALLAFSLLQVVISVLNL